ncbi:glycine cleavage system H protein [Rhodothalassium salexigens DSM 2132]|uniref:Glycine cleavage system H protein n=1 Tax=Rhodothalassium salexigens DSM 2132 TaxID=1188247 RepID=A0A4R2PR51_RHOSA|nr:glycine cleavage system protein GcvH [Rhodothalassium salexigens]MBB4210022.1 glycine cleavage system H protein [Rhodothalassium salexigens DSM 2132]MBK1637607.1 glycine cleavage system protein H [Rhodothalassium salexigens DSM 2132]TCP38187.1 glycine cleavage system H protein [Rhodothalassium salexigens DSM 2132]
MTEIYFSKDHEWIKVDGDEGTVGITTHAQEQLGDVVFVELPEVDAEFAKGDEVAVVESVKAASEIYAPVSGTIIAVNEVLGEEPGKVNASPEDDGWFFKIKINDKGDLSDLMGEDAYKDLTSD